MWNPLMQPACLDNSVGYSSPSKKSEGLTKEQQRIYQANVQAEQAEYRQDKYCAEKEKGQAASEAAAVMDHSLGSKYQELYALLDGSPRGLHNAARLLDDVAITLKAAGEQFVNRFWHDGECNGYYWGRHAWDHPEPPVPQVYNYAIGALESLRWEIVDISVKKQTESCLVKADEAAKAIVDETVGTDFEKLLPLVKQGDAGQQQIDGLVAEAIYSMVLSSVQLMNSPACRIDIDSMFKAAGLSTIVHPNFPQPDVAHVFAEWVDRLGVGRRALVFYEASDIFDWNERVANHIEAIKGLVVQKMFLGSSE